MKTVSLIGNKMDPVCRAWEGKEGRGPSSGLNSLSWVCAPEVNVNGQGGPTQHQAESMRTAKWVYCRECGNALMGCEERLGTGKLFSG